MPYQRRFPALRLSAAIGIVTAAALTGCSPAPDGMPTDPSTLAAPGTSAPPNATDLLAAARQDVHAPAFSHAGAAGERQWSKRAVRFPTGHYTLRTSCVGKGTVSGTISGIGSWTTDCVAGQITVNQDTESTGGRPVDFSFTAARGVRFAVVAAG